MIIRIAFVILSALVGFYIFSIDLGFQWLGLLVASVAISAGLLVEYSIRRIPSFQLLGGILGLAGGTIAAVSISALARPFFLEQKAVYLPGQLVLLLTLGYLGLVIGFKSGRDTKGGRSSSFSLDGSSSQISNKILDTSVIIDGRIADLCETGFLEGTFIIPQFVLMELQRIADSSDSMKRSRGRRGLDILHRVQKMTELDVRIVDNDFPQIREVDSKLVALGKEINGKVITNDLNLNKVAELQGVKVLNINELCNALKPVVLPGEVMRVFVLKEGKEFGQGVAYLDDGTMIVVDSARKLIGRNVDVVVTSVLQTTAGRMIFTRIRDNGDK